MATNTESGHIMFYTECQYTFNFRSYDGVTGADRILIATLGYGCSTEHYDDPNFRRDVHVLREKNFVTNTPPVYHRYYRRGQPIDDDDKLPPLTVSVINEYTKSSPFIVCQTTSSDGTIANGATAKTIKWLREEWKEKWQKEYDNLVILIPYGGQYMEDEMREIYGATDEGIIIVCAAGGQGGGVVFPAALGTVISVGVAGSGPTGREVDICVEFTKNDQLVSLPVHNTSLRPTDSGIAAARVTGLLSLLLARLNLILESTNPVIEETAKFIKEVPLYLHTCVIRELLVNEGTGSHDPQRGYGNGENILRILLCMDSKKLLQKLANVHFIVPDSAVRQQNDPNFQPFNEQTIKHLSDHHDLDGNGVTVAVIDQHKEVETAVYNMGASHQTRIRPFVTLEDENSLHGDKCAAVVNAICPQATILCVNEDSDDSSCGFFDCSDQDLLVNIDGIDRNIPIDIISYSISLPSFDFNLCQVVNQAVLAGKIIVFAAGNAGQRLRNTIGYPGRIGNVLVIGGRDRYYIHLSFSSVGREMDFLAPADLGRSYVGTSYAAPSVAGYIALLLQFIKRMDEKGIYNITAWWSWSKHTNDYKWQSVPIYEAAHNVYAMRALLKALLSKPQPHSDREGFGCLDFSVLFPTYRIPTLDPSILNTPVAERIIHETLQSFYKRN